MMMMMVIIYLEFHNIFFAFYSDSFESFSIGLILVFEEKNRTNLC